MAKVQTTMIHPRLSVQLVAELDAFATRIGNGKTRAQVIRDALAQYLCDERTLSRLESQHAQTLAALAAVNKRNEDAANDIRDTLTVIGEQNQNIIKMLSEVNR